MESIAISGSRECKEPARGLRKDYRLSMNVHNTVIILYTFRCNGLAFICVQVNISRLSLSISKEGMDNRIDRNSAQHNHILEHASKIPIIFRAKDW